MAYTLAQCVRDIQQVEGKGGLWICCDYFVAREIPGTSDFSSIACDNILFTGLFAFFCRR